MGACFFHFIADTRSGHGHFLFLKNTYILILRFWIVKGVEREHE
jgi:hypothetical protein